MASSTGLTVVGALLAVVFGLPALTFQIPRKSSSSLSFLSNGDLSPPFNCYWRLSRAKIVSNSRGFAVEKEAEDGFISNVSEDSDEMFDDLFNKYGKVVYKSHDQKSATAQVDDDAEREIAVEMGKVASEVKAGDIKVLFVKPLVYWTRFFIIATAFSRPQIDAIGSRMRDLAENKYGKVANGYVKPNAWTLLDFGDVVIHISYLRKEPSVTWKISTEMPCQFNFPFKISHHHEADDDTVCSRKRKGKQFVRSLLIFLHRLHES